MPGKTENLRPGSPEWRAFFLNNGMQTDLEEVEEFCWWLATNEPPSRGGPALDEIEKRAPALIDEILGLEGSFGSKISIRNRAMAVAIEMRRRQLSEERDARLVELETAIRDSGLPSTIFDDIELVG